MSVNSGIFEFSKDSCLRYLFHADQILKESFYTSPRLGTINVMLAASILSRSQCTDWALINDEEEFSQLSIT